MAKTFRYVSAILVLSMALMGASAYAGPKKGAKKVEKMDTAAIDSELDSIDLELESAALDAVLIDAEPGDNIFPVDANAKRSAAVEEVDVKRAPGAIPGKPQRAVRR